MGTQNEEHGVNLFRISSYMWMCPKCKTDNEETSVGSTVQCCKCYANYVVAEVCEEECLED
jgi:hypothetical protein